MTKCKLYLKIKKIFKKDILRGKKDILRGKPKPESLIK